MWKIFWSLLNQFNFFDWFIEQILVFFFFLNHSCSISIRSATLKSQRPSLIINFTYWELQTKFQSQKSCSLLSVCQLSVVFLCHFRFIHFFLHCEKMAVWRERGVNWMSLTVTARELASLLKRKPEKHLISTKCICNVVTYLFFPATLIEYVLPFWSLITLHSSLCLHLWTRTKTLHLSFFCCRGPSVLSDQVQPLLDLSIELSPVISASN